MNAEQLSYREMTLDSSGSIMNNETKEALRKQHGFCTTCPGSPVLLFDMSRSRVNPLWCTKKPRTSEGECLKGRCIRCNPKLAAALAAVASGAGAAGITPSSSSRSLSSTSSTPQQHQHYHHQQPHQKHHPEGSDHSRRFKNQQLSSSSLSSPQAHSSESPRTVVSASELIPDQHHRLPRLPSPPSLSTSAHHDGTLLQHRSRCNGSMGAGFSLSIDTTSHSCASATESRSVSGTASPAPVHNRIRSEALDRMRSASGPVLTSLPESGNSVASYSTHGSTTSAINGCGRGGRSTGTTMTSPVPLSASAMMLLRNGNPAPVSPKRQSKSRNISQTISPGSTSSQSRPVTNTNTQTMNTNSPRPQAMPQDSYRTLIDSVSEESFALATVAPPATTTTLNTPVPESRAAPNETPGTNTSPVAATVTPDNRGACPHNGSSNNNHAGIHTPSMIHHLLSHQQPSFRSSTKRTNSKRFSDEEKLPDDLPAHVDLTFLETATSDISMFQASSHDIFTPNRAVQQQDQGKDKILEDLEALVSALEGDDDVGVLAEILVASMDSHPSMENIQLFCLKTMAEVFQDTIIESPVIISKIIDAMNAFASSLDIQKFGCRVICTLSEGPTNCDLLVRHGVCKCVSEAISRHIGDVDLVCITTTALRQLTVLQSAREQFQQLEVSKQVAEAMLCNKMNTDIQRDGCAVLSNLSVDTKKNAVSVVHVYVLEAVVGALMTHTTDEAVIESATFALKNFTFEDDNNRTLRNVEGIFELLQRVISNGGCNDAAFVLERLQLSRAEDESMEDQVEESLSAMMALGTAHQAAVKDAIDLMHAFKWSSKIVRACIRALKSLASISDGHKASIQEEELFRLFIECVQFHSHDVIITQESRSLMSLLSASKIVRNRAGTSCDEFKPSMRPEVARSKH